MKVDQYKNSFNATHPEAGELSDRTQLTGEQAKHLGELFRDRIKEISWKHEAMTAEEAMLVDQTVEFGTRCVIFTEDHYGFKLPDDEGNRKKIVAAAYGMYDVMRKHGVLPRPAESDEDVLTVMHSIVGRQVSSCVEASMRAPAEDYAKAIMPYFGNMVAENGGLELDNYLAGTLQNLLAAYEMVEQPGITQISV